MPCSDPVQSNTETSKTEKDKSSQVLPGMYWIFDEPAVFLADLYLWKFFNLKSNPTPYVFLGYIKTSSLSMTLCIVDWDTFPLVRLLQKFFHAHWIVFLFVLHHLSFSYIYLQARAKSVYKLLHGTAGIHWDCKKRFVWHSNILLVSAIFTLEYFVGFCNFLLYHAISLAHSIIV